MKMCIHDVLKFGQYEGLKIGSGEADIYNAIGERKLQKHLMDEFGELSIIIYGPAEFHLYKNKLISLVIKLSGVDKKTISLEKSRSFINYENTLEDIVGLMYDLNIDWEISSKYSSKKIIVLLTEGGATIEFVGEEGKVKINRIHLTED